MQQLVFFKHNVPVTLVNQKTLPWSLNAFYQRNSRYKNSPEFVLWILTNRDTVFGKKGHRWIFLNVVSNTNENPFSYIVLLCRYCREGYLKISRFKSSRFHWKSIDTDIIELLPSPRIFIQYYVHTYIRKDMNESERNILTKLSITMRTVYNLIFNEIFTVYELHLKQHM